MSFRSCRAIGALVLLAGLCSGQTTPLSFRPIDAEYSTPLDRIVMVSENPNQLHIYDANSGFDTVVALPKAPSSVSVSPNGLYAAVGHDALITYVNLASASVVRTFTVSMNVTDLVLAAQYVHVLPATSVHLATGVVSTSSNSYYSGGTGPRLHPSGKAIYAGSSSYAYIYDVSTGPITTSRNSTYGNGFCGPVWFSQDGSLVYMGCGTAHRPSSDPTQNMTYRTMFMTPSGLRWLAESVALKSIAAIPQPLYGDPPGDNEIWLFDSTYLNLRGRYLLPEFSVGGKNHKAHGKYVFYSADSSALFTLMQADTASGLLNDYAVHRIATANPPPCAPTFAASTSTAPARGGLATIDIEAASDCMYTAASSVPWITTVSGQHGTGKQTLTYLVRGNSLPTSRTGAIAIGGSRFEITQDAAPASLSPQTRLAYNVVDSEYSKGLDKLIIVSAGPDELHIFDPNTRQERVAPLPTAPLSVGVRPDGLYAAVGHRGWISIVNLETAAVEKVYEAPANITDVILAGNGYAYGFTNQSSSIQTLNLSTEVLTTQSGYADPARLHPSGNYLYIFDYSASKWNIRNGIPERVANSPYTETCYGLWPSESGNRLFTGCGKVYRFSEIVSEDWQYNGTLGSNLVWADPSAVQESVAVIPGNISYPSSGSTIDQEVRIYGDAYLGIAGRVPLAKFDVAAAQHAAHGKFVFWSKDASSLVAVAKADSSSKLLSDWAVQVVGTSTGTDGCAFTLGTASATAAAGGSFGDVAVSSADGCVWRSNSSAPWLVITAGKFSVGPGLVSYNVLPNPTISARAATLSIAGKTFTVTQAAGEITVTLTPVSATAPGFGADRTVTLSTSSPAFAWTAVSNVAWISILSGASGNGSGTVRYAVEPNGMQARTGTLTIAGRTVTVTQQPHPGDSRLRFVPITPCRVLDTRLPDGPFGGPQIPADGEREFEVPLSGCGIPETAAAYSLNLTVVPTGQLGYVTLWPARQERPTASTLNSHDGRVKANAAIIRAGYGGGVSVYATQATQIVLDISGYFVPDADTSALAFYPVTPCRMVDTRIPGSLGSPMIPAGTTRQLALRSSACNVPATAKAYSLNITAVPKTALSYLTVWPSGQGKPLASTLNAHTGAVTANAAIVPAGTNGAVEVYVTHDSDVVVDINGYFAPSQADGLSLYATSPCRALDTRFVQEGVTRLDAALNCSNPAAKAFVLNATAVPQGPLGYLTLWPGGQAPQPTVSTLNAQDGQVTSNMAIVPTTTSPMVTAFLSNRGHLVLDMFGYFAP